VSRVRAALRRPEAALFALVLGAYAYFYQAGGWNQNVRFDLVRAIVEDGSLRIDRFAHNSGDLARRNGHLYCDKAPGLSLLGAVPYEIVHLIAPTRRPSPRYLAWASWLTTVVAVGLPSALGVAFLAFLLRALGLRAGPAVAVAAAWGLATLALPYSTLFYGHQVVAALLIMAFALLVRIARGHDPPGVGRLIAIGALGAGAIVVEYPAALAVLVLAGYAVACVPRRKLVWIAIGGAIPGAILAWYHTAAFGGPLTLPYSFSTQGPRHAGWFMGLGAPRQVALTNILVTPYRGLFYSAPWLLLAVPGAIALWRRYRRAEVVVAVAVTVLFVWMNASLVDWQGGWAMGPRYLIPCVPFLAVLAGGCFSRAPGAATGPISARPAWRRHRVVVAIAAILVGWSAFVMLAGTAVQPEVEVHVKHPLWGFHVPHLVRGEVAISTQSIDMPDHPARGPRHAWNLGEKAGLGGGASLIPLLAWCAALGIVLARRARRDH
jgi:hypothetical protein